MRPARRAPYLLKVVHAHVRDVEAARARKVLAKVRRVQMRDAVPQHGEVQAPH
jgi:hypothetical protein